MSRKRKRRSAAKFARTANRTRKINITPKFTRGGIRL